MFDKGSMKLLGTPTKKRKLNQGVFLDQELEMDFGLKKKKSLIECFQFIGAIKRKDSIRLPITRKQSTSKNPLEFTEWDEPDFRCENSIQKMNLNTAMDIQDLDSRNSSESQSSQDEIPKQIKFVKRVTMQVPSHLAFSTKLYRCNSGIDIDMQINEADQRKYGDNIYVEQISQLNRKKTNNSKQNNSKAANQAFNRNFNQNYDRKAYQQNSDSEEQQNQEERLLQDYEISSNLHAYVKNHENYLCLNKLQRIFYYVKKINFSEEYTEQQISQLCQSQIRLYNKDDEGHMLRYYQCWEEEQCVYLVFETASTSMQQKLISGIKLRQNQVWTLLTDICSGLSWMKQNGENHLNIKPGNLLKCREKYKLSDPFGSYQVLEKAMGMFKGKDQQEQKLKIAFNYAAPQIIQYRAFIKGLQFQKCDIYSLGLCILENITGISVNILKRSLKSLRLNNQDYLKRYSPALRNLLIKMISLDPSRRPTAEQISSIRQQQYFQLKQKTNANDDLKASPQKNKRRMSF